uniref:Uncharacterized protein n=1 Tax=Palpitomonas bilix TaxID=652834 RepID=A0A7S3D2S0_9EUKA|mmetsp:Transcript_19649/g.50329  ORF Transcript_19649/g.50329 Transcript_19649/m.50329 type:complete len:201 (+) Transcript_19649:69-671(+)|eukprot:CAMPEP_0113875102 /NCGR_PEP_ID=MMETSP0780_2-20120614/4746_1 /TAXON_ID=652834 /ORGANISM="Palpitomonas bilix" /LENGTH=200 /DNA_ID=CAMNT_0000861035 /DNA_START=72 /DNA_END=674 /DNA_ORIENTATION=+ /assembly_acc=CAM_ASM_000599
MSRPSTGSGRRSLKLVEAQMETVLHTAEKERALRARVQSALEETLQRQESLTKALEIAEARIQELHHEKQMAEKFFHARIDHLKANFASQIKSKEEEYAMELRAKREENQHMLRKERDRERDRRKELRLGLEDELTSVQALEKEVEALREKNSIALDEVQTLVQDKRVLERERAMLRVENSIMKKLIMDEKREVERLMRK